MSSILKKIKEFIKLNWTVRLLLITITVLFAVALPVGAQEAKTNADKAATSVSSSSATDKKDDEINALKAELAVAREEAKLLRAEVSELSKKCEERDARLRKLQMSVAGMLLEGEVRPVSDKEDEAVQTLYVLIKACRQFLSKSQGFCCFLEQAVDGLSVPDSEKVKIKCRLDEFSEAAQELNAHIGDPGAGLSAGKCKILSVDDRLKLVSISGGSADGMRSGMVVGVEGKEGLKLKLVAVRPFISAAMAVEGEIGDVAPGMAVKAVSGAGEGK